MTLGEFTRISTVLCPDGNGSDVFTAWLLLLTLAPELRAAVYDKMRIQYRNETRLSLL